MKAEEYLSQNQELIREECRTIIDQGCKAIVTLKENGESYVHKIATVDQFTAAIPDNEFFKKMRAGITNAVLNKVVPIVVFEGQKARLISMSDYFEVK